MSIEFTDSDQRWAEPRDDGLDGLHFAAVIGGRRLYFAAFPSQARFRITMARAWERRTEALGSVIRLDTEQPGLRVCAPQEVEWAEQHAEKIIAEAVSMWKSITRGCEAFNGELEAGRRTAVGQCADLFIIQVFKVRVAAVLAFPRICARVTIAFREV